MYFVTALSEQDQISEVVDFICQNIEDSVKSNDIPKLKEFRKVKRTIT